MKGPGTPRPDLLGATTAFLDPLFGEGAGEKHSRFLARIGNEGLREVIHRFHLMEADTRHLSLEENYLIGMCVLCAGRSYGTAAMFAKTLLRLGVSREKILEAVARLSMWTGGLPAVEATFAIQKAIREYEEQGLASLAAWFPEER
jgi:alkylhydroperoxidase/carboxymuconolactone decarboxylase family protein YurZ